MRRLHQTVYEILEGAETTGLVAKQGLGVETVLIEAFKSTMERGSLRWGQVARAAKLSAD